jgi:hypothetical protein
VKQFITLGSLSALFIMAAPCLMATTTINFDDILTGSGPVQLTTQYEASGVIFDQISASQQFKFNIIPPSAPNYASPFITSLAPGTISFVDPANFATAAYSQNVTLTLVGLTASDAHPGNYSGATINALDLQGNVITGQTQVVPGVNTTTPNTQITFTGQIHALRFTIDPSTAGTFPIDNLTFDTLTGVPEPSTLILTLSAVAAVVLRRRR